MAATAPRSALLAGLATAGVIARNGEPAPVQAGTRWVVERTPAWMNGCGDIVDSDLLPAATVVVARCLVPRARTHYRRDNRPTARRLE